MTDRKAARRGSGTPAVAESPRRRPAALPTVLVALACFAVVFEFLAMQLKSGHDPALGNTSAASSPAKVRPRKKIIITTVIPAGNGGPTGQTTSSSGGYAAPAPVVSSTS